MISLETKPLAADESPVMLLPVGTMLKGGTYRILSHLGQGGFGITYLAEHIAMSRRVCIKEFFIDMYCMRDNSNGVTTTAPNLSRLVDGLKQKFVKEAAVLGTLDHPNIVRVHDSFTENNSAYYVMEYIDGDTLDNIVKREGALSESVAVGYIREVAKALDYIHRRNMLHLDVKPSNIMVRNGDNRVILIDFGLTKHYSEESGMQTTPSVSGTSDGYAPIEQYQNGVESFTPQTDVYSLGATLYAILTATNPPMPSAAGLATFPSHPTVKFSAGVRKAIRQAMQYDSTNRPRSVGEFVELLAGGGKRRRVWPTILLAAILCVAIGVAALLFISKEDRSVPVTGESEATAEEIISEARSNLDAGNYEEAFALWRDAADMGSEEAVMAVADCYNKGIGVDADRGLAIEWYTKAADMGNATAMFNLGICYANDGEYKDVERAVECFREAAELGHATAQYQLGVMSLNGQYIDKNVDDAVMWFKRAADSGHAKSEYALAYYYSRMNNMTQAVEWYSRAAEHGVAEAQYDLGICYFNGYGGLTVDRRQALEWYRKAANQGYEPAIIAVAECIKNGWGVE